VKKNLILTGIISFTVILAVLSAIIAIKIYKLGTRPVVPSVPESKPAAVVPLPTLPPSLPPTSCVLRFGIPTPSQVVTPTATVTPTSTVAPTASVTPPGPTSTATPTFTPTLTSTPSPTATATPPPEPTATNTPEPTSTTVPGQSYCDYLRASVSSGSVPLTVRFYGKGYDSTRIKGFRFSFGDGGKEEFLGSFAADYIQEVEHLYQKSGIFIAKLEILDNGDHWRTRGECELSITVSGLAVGPTNTPRPTSTPKPAVPTPTEMVLPEAGIKIPTLGGIIMGFLLISLGVALVF